MIPIEFENVSWASIANECCGCGVDCTNVWFEFPASYDNEHERSQMTFMSVHCGHYTTAFGSKAAMSMLRTLTTETSPSEV